MILGVIEGQIRGGYFPDCILDPSVVDPTVHLIQLMNAHQSLRVVLGEQVGILEGLFRILHAWSQNTGPQPLYLFQSWTVHEVNSWPMHCM